MLGLEMWQEADRHDRQAQPRCLLRLPQRCQFLPRSLIPNIPNCNNILMVFTPLLLLSTPQQPHRCEPFLQATICLYGPQSWALEASIPPFGYHHFSTTPTFGRRLLLSTINKKLKAMAQFLITTATPTSTASSIAMSPPRATSHCNTTCASPKIEREQDHLLAST